MVLDIKIKIIHQKKGSTTTEVKAFDGTFVVKLCGMNIEESLFKHN